MNRLMPLQAMAGLLAVLSFGALAEEKKGDTVSLSVGQQRDRIESQDLPENGMTREAVKSRFGEPQRQVSAVGEPPISRWVYDDYVVYFEHDRVLRSVVKYPDES